MTRAKEIIESFRFLIYLSRRYVGDPAFLAKIHQACRLTDELATEWHITFTECPDCKGSGFTTSFSQCPTCHGLCTVPACGPIQVEENEMSDLQSINVNVEPIVLHTAFTQVIEKLLASIAPEDRAKVLQSVNRKYCSKCGREQPSNRWCLCDEELNKP